MGMKLEILKDIAFVTTGYSFRNAIKNDPYGNIAVLQAKDIKDNIQINKSLLDTIQLPPSSKSSLIKSGDVVLSSRGNYRAAVIETSNDIVASSSVFVIHDINPCVDPFFLAIYFNSPEGQASLTKITSGGSIKSLLKQHLEHVTIPLPSISKQRQIVTLYKNIALQKRLLQKKAELLTEINDAVCSIIISNNRNEI
jgi:restriction endonuclease S subunit